ncbi:hypothetical protein TNCV_3808971 [Trichonephila clavipes]|nr:hypothetical protein TNCV_3808971 [Trichonephila clavipes]
MTYFNLQTRKATHSLTDSLTNHDISGTIKPTDLKFGRSGNLNDQKFINWTEFIIISSNHSGWEDRGYVRCNRDPPLCSDQSAAFMVCSTIPKGHKATQEHPSKHRNSLYRPVYKLLCMKKAIARLEDGTP